MEITEQIEALRLEIEAARHELQELLMDIRVYLLEAQNPTRPAGNGSDPLPHEPVPAAEEVK